MTRYKFLGKPDKRFPDLKTGEIYELEIEERSKGLLGFLVGNTTAQIVSPFMCPYRSWDTFYANWKKA